ncbi:hypothetical protein AVEN_255461-1, partial [Araneus ventricosus]
PVYYYHKNKESSFKVEPGFFAEERGGKYPDHVKVETDGHIAEPFRYLAKRFNPCHGNLCDNPLPLPTTRFPKSFRQAFFAIWVDDLSIDKNLFASIGVFIPFDQTTFGAGINRRATLSLPLKIKLDLEVKEKKLSYQWTPVKHEIYHFKYEPYTYTDLYGNGVPAVLEDGYHPVQRKSRKHVSQTLFYSYLQRNFRPRWPSGEVTALEPEGSRFETFYP